MKKLRFAFAIIGAAWAAPASADCARLPEPVLTYLKSETNWRMRQLDDLDKDSQSEWRKVNKDACPGMATVDLDGRGPGYALLLERSGDGKRTQKTVVVGRRAGIFWQKTISPEFATPVPEIVVRAAPGRYKDIESGRKFALAHDGVIVGSWDAWSSLYYLSGGKVKSFQYTN